MSKIEWSNYQRNIFLDVAKGKGHTVIEALAGSGKTASLIESLDYIPGNKSWLLVAFNKKIAVELQEKAPSTGDVRTLHSLGLRSLYKKFPKLVINNDKNRILLDKLIGKQRNLWELKAAVAKAISLCKGYLIDGAEFIDHIMDNHDIDCGDIDRDLFINYVQRGMEAGREETRFIDFDDMIWFPHVYNIPLQRYHFVMIDEVQDLTNGQIALALKACKRNGRIIAYGDQMQCLYSFRGVSLSSMDNLIKKLNAKTLPLSITYRCPRAVVKEAQVLVPELEAWDQAAEGLVEKISIPKMKKLAKPGCFILSRANAPLIGLALEFIRKSIPAAIQGRDIGTNLLNLIKKSRKKTLTTFLTWLDGWERRETKRLYKKHRSPRMIVDKAACMRALSDSSHDLKEMKSKIKMLFEDTDDHGKIVLSTVHQAKGLQRDVIFMLMNTFRTHTQEEKNIKYVAISRSAGELYYVS